MKKIAIIGMGFVVLLSACEPRDVKILSESERGRGRFRQQDGASAPFLSEFSVAAHSLERQIEALSVLEDVQDSEKAKKLAYQFTIEDSNKFVQESETRWGIVNEPRIQFSLRGSADRVLKLKKLEAKTEIENPALKVDETGKELSIEQVSEGTYRLSYSLTGSFRRQGPKYTENYDFAYSLQSEVKKLADHKYEIMSSTMKFKNRKSEDKTWFRDATYVTAPGFVLVLGPCPAAIGQLRLMDKVRVDQVRSTLEFDTNSISELSNKANAKKDELMACQANEARPIIDFSRLLRI